MTRCRPTTRSLDACHTGARVGGDGSAGFVVRLDVTAPGDSRGVDVDEDGTSGADYQRTYQLIRQAGPIGDRRFEIEVLDAGVEMFVFTSG
jgi:hypothetical protein